MEAHALVDGLSGAAASDERNQESRSNCRHDAATEGSGAGAIWFPAFYTAYSSGWYLVDWWWERQPESSMKGRNGGAGYEYPAPL